MKKRQNALALAEKMGRMATIFFPLSCMENQELESNEQEVATVLQPLSNLLPREPGFSWTYDTHSGMLTAQHECGIVLSRNIGAHTANFSQVPVLVAQIKNRMKIEGILA